MKQQRLSKGAQPESLEERAGDLVRLLRLRLRECGLTGEDLPILEPVCEQAIRAWLIAWAQRRNPEKWEDAPRIIRETPDIEDAIIELFGEDFPVEVGATLLRGIVRDE